MKKYIIKIRNFFRNASKKKLLIIIGIILSAVLIIGGVTYAYVNFTITGTKDNLIKAGCLKVELTEANNINLTNTVPMLDEKGLALQPYTYTIKNSCSTDAYYETNLAILNTSNLENTSKTKVALRGDSYLSPTIISALGAGTLTETYSDVSTAYLLDTGYLKVGESKTFNLTMWIDYNATEITGDLNARVIITAISKEGPNYKSSTSGYTVYKNTEEAKETGVNPNYSYISPYTDANNRYTQTSGLFKIKNKNDNYEHYFRGNIDNNYLTFAGFTWRIIKINEDGSLKLILDDVLTSTAYSSSTTTASLTYTDSSIKTTLETWYGSNLQTYDKYILSYNYCNDLSNSNNYYGAYTRNVTTNNPSYICGSEEINQKIGLITIDEVAFAGGLYNTNNTEYYLYKNNSWWTMSPAYYSDSSCIFSVDANGAIKTITTTSSAYIRPVINLTYDAMLSGTGTESSKYNVIGLYSDDKIYTDTTPPTISYARVNESNQILVGATDGPVGSGIGGYYISTSSTTPTTASEGWINEKTESLVTEDMYSVGTYYIWAKDVLGNISSSQTVKVSKEINSPELASNMISVYYDETNKVWKKADETNTSTKYKWYDYNNKIWANAVTVKDLSFDDLSGNNTEMTIEDATSSTEGLLFDGTNDGIKIDNGFGVTLPATYSVTFKVDNLDTSNIIFGDYDTKIALGVLSSGNFYVTLGSVSYPYIKAGISTGTYYNVTIVANSTSDIKVYLNGAELTIVDESDYWAWTDGSYIGKRNYTTTRNLSGTIKNFMVWDEILTTDQITNLSTNNTYSQVPKNNLTTYYDFTAPIKRENIANAKAGTTVPMNSINTMWVWVPRFSATSNGDYNGGTQAAPGPFNITFVNNKQDAHDAFTFGDQNLNGFWYAKFETGGTLSADGQACINETCDISNVIIKPNVTSLRSQTASSLFYVSRSMQQNSNPYGFSTATDLNVHMSKNNEWGAVAYLTQSEYGRCTNGTCPEVTPNNCSSFVTGIGANSVSEASSSTTCTESVNKYNGSKGILASTTGNIYGIYDMSGGAYEFVMGIYSDGTNIYSGYSTDYNSGFNGYLYNDGTPTEKTDGIEFFSTESNNKYYNVYTTSENYTSSNLQHGSIETSYWYGDYYYFVNNYYQWFTNGGYYNDGGYRGIWSKGITTGTSNTNYGSRITLTVK